MKRATFLKSGMALAAGTALAGCSGGGGEDAGGGGGTSGATWSIPSEDPTATITVVGTENSDTTGMANVLDAFHKAHPNITVKYQHIPFNNLGEVLDSRISSKTGDPDVFWVDQPRIASRATHGYVEDLTAQFGKLTSGLEKVTVEAVTFQDKLWALPMGNSTQVLYYNADLLKKAGVEPPSTDPDKRITWQQLKADAQQVQKKAGAKYGLLLQQPTVYYQLEPLPASAGGGVGAKGENNLTPDVNNSQWVESMTYYGSLFSEKISPRAVSSTQTVPTFIAGHTGYLIGANRQATLISEQAKFDWGGGLNPVWEGGKPYTPTGSWNIGLNPFSKNKAAGAVFMKFMTIDGKGGYSMLPNPPLLANKDAAEDYLQRKEFTSSEGGKQSAEVIAYEVHNTALPRVKTVGYLEFETFIDDAFSDISNGTEPKKALDTAQQKIETAWKKYQ